MESMPSENWKPGNRAIDRQHVGRVLIAPPASRGYHSAHNHDEGTAQVRESIEVRITALVRSVVFTFRLGHLVVAHVARVVRSEKAIVVHEIRGKTAPSWHFLARHPSLASSLRPLGYLLRPRPRLRI